MKKFLLLITLIFLAACDSPKKTLEILQRDVAAYAIEPTPANEQKVQSGFGKIEADIAKLNESGKTVEAASLQSQLDTLRSQYETARLAGSLQKARHAIEGFGQSVKNLGEQIGEVFKPTPTPQEN